MFESISSSACYSISYDFDLFVVDKIIEILVN